MAVRGVNHELLTQLRILIKVLIAASGNRANGCRFKNRIAVQSVAKKKRLRTERECESSDGGKLTAEFAVSVRQPHARPHTFKVFPTTRRFYVALIISTDVTRIRPQHKFVQKLSKCWWLL